MRYANKEYENLASITRQVSRALDNVTGSSAKISRQNTSTLFGIVGGFLGLGAAYVLALTFPVSLPAVGLILTGLGISSGVLGYRLSRGVEIEDGLERNRIVCDEILDRIKRLPPGTPKDVRDQLWLTYKTLNAVPQIIAALPSPATETQGNAEPRLLPAPTQRHDEGAPNRDT